MKLYKFPTAATPSERIISALSYLTMGLVGFIWLIIVSLQRREMSSFLKYHVFQSLFLSVLTAIAGIVVQLLMSMVKIVPFVGEFVLQASIFINTGFFAGLSLINIAIATVVIYFAITSLMGKYSYFPWISDNVRQMI